MLNFCICMFIYSFSALSLFILERKTDYIIVKTREQSTTLSIMALVPIINSAFLLSIILLIAIKQLTKSKD